VNCIRKELIFLVKFFAIYFVLQAVILLAPLGWMQNFIALLEAGLLGLKSSANAIQAGGGTFIIAANCTGLVSASILAAVVFSLKKPEFKKKLLVFVTGSFALMLLNLVRLYLVLLVASSFGVGLADTAHTISWFTTAALVLVAWYFGTKKIAKVTNFKELL
jgi:exosortase/archaeosortase family protein